uniref:CSLD2 n=1 Tax=Arundo donax TaxID=35708 RepID=A0A0A9GIG7_ARUDO
MQFFVAPVDTEKIGYFSNEEST